LLLALALGTYRCWKCYRKEARPEPKVTEKQQQEGLNTTSVAEVGGPSLIGRLTAGKTQSEARQKTGKFQSEANTADIESQIESEKPDGVVGTDTPTVTVEAVRIKFAQRSESSIQDKTNFIIQLDLSKITNRDEQYKIIDAVIEAVDHEQDTRILKAAISKLRQVKAGRHLQKKFMGAFKDWLDHTHVAVVIESIEFLGDMLRDEALSHKVKDEAFEALLQKFHNEKETKFHDKVVLESILKVFNSALDCNFEWEAKKDALRKALVAGLGTAVGTAVTDAAKPVLGEVFHELMQKLDLFIKAD